MKGIIMKYLIFIICISFMISLHSCTHKAIIEKEEGKPMISVIPQPVKALQKDGSFMFNEKVKIVIRNEKLQPEANYLAEWLERTAGYRLPILTEQNINQLPVVKDGNIIGMIARDNLLSFISIRSELGK